MAENDNYEPLVANPTGSGKMKKIGLILLGLVIAFLLGFAPQWWSKKQVQQDLNTTQRQLQISRWRGVLGSAAIDARRGEYELARQATSKFFTEARADLDGGNSVFTEVQQAQMKTVMAPRDEVITLLSRNDPASLDKLTDLFLAYRGVAGQGF